VTYGSDAAYESMKMLGSDSKNTPTTCVDVYGAKVIKITSGLPKPLGLNEIEIFDENGNNVALGAQCYSSSSNAVGDPNCLNDGMIGRYPAKCISQSSAYQSGNFDFCVLAEPVNVQTVTIYPAKGANMSYLTNWLKSLTLEFFSAVDGLESVNDYKNVGSKVSFLGPLASYDITDQWTGGNSSPFTQQGMWELLLVTEYIASARI